MSTSTETRPTAIGLLQRAAFVSTFDRFAMSPMLLAIAHDMGVPLGSVVRAAGVYFLVKHFRRFPTADLLQPGVAGPTHDSEEPGTTLPAMKTAEEFPRPQVSFLHNIFRVLVIPRQPARQVVGGMEMRYDCVFKP